MTIRATNENVSFTVLEKDIIELWQCGADTLEIASLLDPRYGRFVSEAEVYGILNDWLTRKSESRT